MIIFINPTLYGRFGQQGWVQCGNITINCQLYLTLHGRFGQQDWVEHRNIPINCQLYLTLHRRFGQQGIINFQYLNKAIVKNGTNMRHLEKDKYYHYLSKLHVLPLNNKGDMGHGQNNIQVLCRSYLPYI
jgi:hypothetical protein